MMYIAEQPKTMKFRIVQYKNRYKVERYNEQSKVWYQIGPSKGYPSPYYAKLFCVKYKKNEENRIVIDEFNL